MYTISTLTRLRRYLGFAAADTNDDPLLLSALVAATAAVERDTGRRFCPRSATILHTLGPDRTLLTLDDDLLTLQSITDASGSVPLTDVLRLPDTGGDAPITVLRLVGGRAFTYDDSPFLSVAVTGIWGWHTLWTRAWVGSGDTVGNNPLGSAATTVLVTDADGADSTGETPRFQVGQLLKIDDEYVRVIAVNTGANQLTVQRGVAGTSAANHANGAAISIFRAAPDAEMLVLQWAAALYRAPDTRAPSFAPAPLRAGLDGLRRVRV